MCSAGITIPNVNVNFGRVNLHQIADHQAISRTFNLALQRPNAGCAMQIQSYFTSLNSSTNNADILLLGKIIKKKV